MTKTETLLHPLRAAVGGLMIIVVAASAAQAQQQTPPTKVRVVPVQQRLMAPVLQVPGTVISRNDARVAAELSGAVEWVAEVGAMVEKGEVIARIDDRLWRLQLRQDEATIKRLDASLKYLRLQVERLAELAANNSTPVSRLDEAVSKRDMMEQDIAQAKIARERTLYQLEHTKVRAPFSGSVVERLLQPGEYSVAGTLVARLVDTSNVEVRARVPVAIASFMWDGMNVSLSDGDITTEAPIRARIPVADEVTRMFEIRVAVPRNTWTIGTALKVAVPRGTAREVIAVPRDALILRSDSTYVFKINDENIAERVVVRIGAASGDFIEVMGRLEKGDKVVVRGGERLREGQQVLAEAIS